jgi:predicted nucleotidyltransferase
MTDPKIVLQDLAQRLRAAFPGKVKEVILHGSHLRGDAREDSDYDFVIVWEGAITWQEKHLVNDVCYETDLHFGVVTHTLVITSNEVTMLRGKQPIFQDAFNQGLRAA